MPDVLSPKRYEPKSIDPENKNTSYGIIIGLVGKNKNVLEIGTSTGYLSKILKENNNSVTGIEIDPNSGETARQYCDSMIIGDIEVLDLSAHLEYSSFDVIVLGDVLEHLKNPGNVLENIKKYLKPDGYLVVSLPNVCHGDVLLNLICGDFRYTPLGLLDCTHLRFFGLKNMLDLFGQSGYSIISVDKVILPIGQTELRIDSNKIPKDLLNFIRLLPNSDVYQFVFKAVPGNISNDRYMSDTQLIPLFNSAIEDTILKRLEPLVQEIAQLSASHNEALSKIETLGRQNHNLEKRIERLVQQLSNRNGTIILLNEQLKNKDNHVKYLEEEINNIKCSLTWRAVMTFQNKFVNRMLPPGTRRGVFYGRAIKAIRIITSEGIGSFFQVFKKYISDRKKILGKKNIKYLNNSHIEDLADKDNQVIEDELVNVDISTFNTCNEYINKFKYNPKISIIMPVFNVDKKWLIKAIESIRCQYYFNWELCIADDASTRPYIREVLEKYRAHDDRIKVVYLAKNKNISGATNEALKLASGEFVCFMDHDDELTRNALYEIVKLLNEHPDADVIYSDDDKIDEYGNRYDFQFKPDWNPELLLSYCYFSHIKVFRRNILERVGGLRSEYDGSQDYDLTLRVTELTDRIYHIPKVLYHWRCLPNSTALSADEKPESMERGRAAVQDAILRRGIAGKVIIPDFALKNKNGIYKINFELKDMPKVSIIIPTKDKIQLLATCIKSIEEKTTYPNYEIVIVDTGSQQKETLEYLNSTNHKVLKLSLEKFNFSKAINYAVANVDSEYVLFLNNDTEIITPSWLEELMGYMQIDKKIGAVGAKLIYRDGRVQHAGVILGLNNGLAGHANKLRHYTDGGYLNYANVVRDYSAITAACMLTRKSCFNEVDGFDENLFAVAYNDVDYCLKLIQRGYRIVYNPYAMIYHYEGSTRGTGANNDDPREEMNFRKKWANVLQKGDPQYNVNLSLDDELFTIKNIGNMNKKLLFVTHNLNLEGAPISEYLLVEGLAARGYDITVVSCSNGPLAEQYINIGVNLVIMPEMLSNETIFKRFLKQNRFDFAYINTIITYPLIKNIKEKKIPLVWVIRESEREYYFDFYKDLSAEHFRMADRVIFVSDATRKIYESLEYNGNFQTIYNGVDIRRIEDYKKQNKKEDLKKQYSFSDKDILITVVGTTCERKGQKFFVEAAINILNITNRIDLHFLVVGARNGPYLHDLEEMIENCGYKDNIHLVKETNRVFDYYYISDIFVCSSLIESLPRVVLEAMAFELPIIASNINGIPEEIEDMKSGILVKAGDSEELSKKLLVLIENKELAKALGRNAFMTVKTKFGLTEMIDHYEFLIKSLI